MFVQGYCLSVAAGNARRYRCTSPPIPLSCLSYSYSYIFTRAAAYDVLYSRGVVGVCKFYVRFLAGHDGYFRAGHVRHHHGAVIRCKEVRVSGRPTVSPGYHAVSERLRCLCSPHARAVYRAAHLSIMHFYEAVGRRHGHTDGHITFKGGAHVVYYALRHERARRVVKKNIVNPHRAGVYGRPRGIATFLPQPHAAWSMRCGAPFPPHVSHNRLPTQ